MFYWLLSRSSYGMIHYDCWLLSCRVHLWTRRLHKCSHARQYSRDKVHTPLRIMLVSNRHIRSLASYNDVVVFGNWLHNSSLLSISYHPASLLLSFKKILKLACYFEPSEIKLKSCCTLYTSHFMTPVTLYNTKIQPYAAGETLGWSLSFPWNPLIHNLMTNRPMAIRTSLQNRLFNIHTCLLCCKGSRIWEF